ncbi:MAG: hypothetical protein Q4D98_12745, partial [Planctomycetia bacterium]|nr:hypothetical protein [Planctomycetia bacterium]
KAAEAKKAEEAKKKAEEEAKKKAAANPFANTPKAVTLPKPGDTGELEIAKVESGDLPWSVMLLGGESAIVAKGGKKKSKEGEAAAPTTFYTLKEGSSDPATSATWEIQLSNKGEEQKIATFKRDGDALKFVWEAEAGKTVQSLVNTALQIDCNGKTHVLALREPIVLETLPLNFKTCTAPIKAGKAVNLPFPSPSVMYLEVVRLGTLPKDDPDVELPQPTLVSEIGPKTPLQIKFKFKDPANNLSYPIVFDFNCVIGNNLVGGLALPKTPAPGQMNAMQLRMAAQMILDPNTEIIINKNNTEISQIKQKMEKEEGWKRDAADTQKIAQKMMQNWGFNLLKKLQDADVEYRIYMDLNGTQIDLITTQPKTDEPPVAKGKRGKKAAEEEDGGEMGGLQF